MSAALSMPAPLRTCDADGTHHFSHIKQLARSGAHYLHAVNFRREPTRPMLVSTAVHEMLLGPRDGNAVVVFSGERRQGKLWDAFAAEHIGRTTLTAPEWEDAEAAASVLRENPLIRAALDGARCEVPLTWEDGGLKCSTTGVDIVGRGMLGDLKGTHYAEPEAWKRTAFRMFYHCQLVWYRRGARANGIDTSNGLFVLGYEMEPPYAVVPLEMTEELIDLGERTLSLWLERLRVLRESIPHPRTAQDWPSYAQAPVLWDLPAWARADDEDDD